MTRLQKAAKQAHEAFADQLDTAFKEKFERELNTAYNIVAMRLVSLPADEKPLTMGQHGWISGYSEGYAAALNQLHIAG